MITYFLKSVFQMLRFYVDCPVEEIVEHVYKNIGNKLFRGLIALTLASIGFHVKVKSYM